MGDTTDRVEIDASAVQGRSIHSPTTQRPERAPGIPPATGVSWPRWGPEADPLRIGEPVFRECHFFDS